VKPIMLFAPGLAALAWAAAAPATVWSIAPSPHSYKVDGWDLKCDGSTRTFNSCAATRAYGGALVTISSVTFAMTARVDTQCGDADAIDGPDHEWSFDDFPYEQAVNSIEADINRARNACGQPPLTSAEHKGLWEMVVLIYGLRPRGEDLAP
jgi:hypothetical protein